MDRRFRLQSVLNYRQSLEEARQLELARIQTERLAALAQLEALRGESVRTVAETQQIQQQERPDVGAILQNHLYLEAVRGAIASQGHTVDEVTLRADEKRSELVTAMRERKVIEKLKQRHDRAYAEWMRHTEQSLVDDMTTIRYSRRSVEEASKA